MNKIIYTVAVAVTAAVLALTTGYRGETEPLTTAGYANGVEDQPKSELIVMEPMYIKGTNPNERCTDCDFSDSPLELIAGEKDQEL